MKIREIIDILDAEVLCDGDLDIEVPSVCSGDMMSDVLAFAKEPGMLITGLVNPQTVRTAEMLDMHCITFVRGKTPGPEIIALAKERNIVILLTQYHMFSACGRLYGAGVRGGCEEQ